MFGKWRNNNTQQPPAIVTTGDQPFLRKGWWKIVLGLGGAGGLALAALWNDEAAPPRREPAGTPAPVKITPPQSPNEVFAGQIRVLTQDVYLALSDGTLRTGTKIVKGSCVEISSGAPGNAGTGANTFLVTAWQKNGNGNNRTGFVEQRNTRPALEGEYTPQNCFAAFVPNAAN